jgi:hypothetical protein
MPGSVCFHFYGDPANYFTYPPEVNPFSGLKRCYDTLSWSWEERIQRVTIKGLYLPRLNSGNTGVYQAYMEELASMSPIYKDYVHALEDRTEDDWVLPVGCLVTLNHWGILQVCILQCPAFRLSDNNHLAYTRGRDGRQYDCPQRAKLVEALADALFQYAYWCHTYAEMGPVKAAMEYALQHLEYGLFVFLTLRKREVPLTDPHLKDLYRPTLLNAYKHIRMLVKGVAERDYTQMAPADVRQFVQAGFLDLLTHDEAIDIGFATPDESWPRTHGGRMQRGPHLDWLENVSKNIYSSKNAKQPQWQGQLYKRLIIRLYDAFKSYGPTKYPKQAVYVAIAEILAMCGLNKGGRAALAEQIRQSLKATDRG